MWIRFLWITDVKNPPVFSVEKLWKQQRAVVEKNALRPKGKMGFSTYSIPYCYDYYLNL